MNTLVKMWDAFAAFLTAHLAPGLKAILGPLDHWLSTLPTSVARGTAVALFAIATIWAFSLKREYIYLGAPDQARWRDLRIWTVMVTLPYIIIYLFLF